MGVAVSESRSWVGAGRSVERWGLVAERGVSSAVVVGQGTRLFPDTGPDIALDLVESRSTPKGVTIQVYRPTGRPQYATATPDLNT